MFLKNNSGITLVALVVTIIVLIILSSITISSLTGDESELKKAQEAKEGASVEDEKEILSLSASQAIKSDMSGNITESNLEQEIAINTDKSVTVDKSKTGDGFLVTFNDTGRIYEVSLDGIVKEQKENKN